MWEPYVDQNPCGNWVLVYTPCILVLLLGLLVLIDLLFRSHSVRPQQRAAAIHPRRISDQRSHAITATRLLSRCAYRFDPCMSACGRETPPLPVVGWLGRFARSRLISVANARLRCPPKVG